jgi:parallel beta-helix repeat protein
MRVGVYLVLATSLWLASSTPAFAATSCTFRTIGQTMQLQSDCWTDATLSIPDGATLDGRGRTITAVDPAGGHFLGAVVRNAGSTAHVRNLTIEARGLADVCDSEGPPDQRLRGILFQAASGSIVRNRVRGPNQTGSGCQEGGGIEVRGALPAQGGPLLQVTIADNRVQGYQKTGVLVSGLVEADVVGNWIEGLGPVSFIAQNGIQLSLGARGGVQWNRVEQNIYTGGDAASTGILVIEAGSPLEIELNRIEDNDIGIRVKSTSDSYVRANVVRGSTYDGIAIDGLEATTQGNQLVANRLADNGVGIDLFGPGATANEVVRNRIVDSYTVGLRVAGSGNEIQRNSVSGSGGLDVENVGQNNYAGNRCTSSSGPPVDCP